MWIITHPTERDCAAAFHVVGEAEHPVPGVDRQVHDALGLALGISPMESTEVAGAWQGEELFHALVVVACVDQIGYGDVIGMLDQLSPALCRAGATRHVDLQLPKYAWIPLSSALAIELDETLQQSMVGIWFPNPFHVSIRFA